MAGVEKRLADIIKGLPPEDKARLVIEDLFQHQSVLSPANRRKALEAMSLGEGRRYNAVIDRYETLKSNVKGLSHLASDIKGQLLMRDRILWFQRALAELEEAITLDPKVAGPLLVDNPPRWSPGRSSITTARW